MVESDNRMRVVIYYAVWATICAALAGIAVALVHTWFFSYHVGRSGFLQTLVSDVEAALAIAAGQGAGGGLLGSGLARLGRGLGKTRLPGFLLRLFDLLVQFVQMGVPEKGPGRGAHI